MKKEKIALVALVIIVVAALSVFLIAVNTTVFEDLFAGPKVIALGDCVNVTYIGRYASNNTVFDSSYAHWQNKTGDNPLRIYVNMNKTATPPVGYSSYTSGFIDGMMEGLIGLKQGQTSVITVTPAKGYGARRLNVGDTFTTSSLTFGTMNNGLNMTMKTLDVNTQNVSIKWMDVQNRGNFTVPDGILMENLENAIYSIYDPLPPYYIWKNSSKISTITDENVVIKTTPTSTHNISDTVIFATVGTKMSFIFPDASTASWNDTKITIHSTPIKNTTYKFYYEGVVFNITVGNVTAANVNITIEMGGQTQNLELNRTLEFNRTFTMRRIFNIPLMFIQYTIAQDLQSQGYSINRLAGETLLFEVTIQKVFKTSQPTS